MGRHVHSFALMGMVWASLATPGCEQPERPPPERGAPSVTQADRTPIPAPPPVLPSHIRPRPEPERSFLGPLEIRETVIIPAAPTPEPERDFPAELRAAFGSPIGCGPLTDEPSLTLHLEVFVTTSGRVSRGDIRGDILGAVPEDTLTCLKSRLEHIRFQDPVPDAPRAIRAHITITGSGGQAERRVLIPRVGPLGFPASEIDD